MSAIRDGETRNTALRQRKIDTQIDRHQLERR
jgi:hypothetical protein